MTGGFFVLKLIFGVWWLAWSLWLAHTLHIIHPWLIVVLVAAIFAFINWGTN